MWKALGATVLAIGLMSAVPASAVTTLTYDNTLKDIQQTDNNPCVIGSPSCGSGDVLPFTTVPGGPGALDLTSPIYTVSQLTTLVGSTAMNLLIDVNQSGGNGSDAISLQLVEVSINGVVQFVFNGPQNVPSVVSDTLNGNGFSDGGLKTLDFSSFAATDTVVFHIVWSNQTDGQESFFLASTTAPPCTVNCFPTVPEPSALILFGAGLVFVPVVIRRFSRPRS
jgi:PEP-CTERM motif-containing protein